MAKKVLVVDDSASMRQMIAFTLKVAGFECTEANDPRKFLKCSDLGIRSRFK